MFLPVHVAAPYLQAGKLKALAVGSPERRPQSSTCRRSAESGLKRCRRRHVVRLLRARHARRCASNGSNREIVAILDSLRPRPPSKQGLIPAAPRRRPRRARSRRAIACDGPTSWPERGIQARVDPMTSTIAGVLAGHAVRDQAAPAIVSARLGTLSFGGLVRHVRQVGAQLAAAGIGPSSRVGIALQRGPEAALLNVAVCGQRHCPADQPQSSARGAARGTEAHPPSCPGRSR